MGKKRYNTSEDIKNEILRLKKLHREQVRKEKAEEKQFKNQIEQSLGQILIKFTDKTISEIDFTKLITLISDNAGDIKNIPSLKGSIKEKLASVREINKNF